jgi:hypothetical protein
MIFVVDAKETELCGSTRARLVGRWVLDVTMGIGPCDNLPQQGSRL